MAEENVKMSAVHSLEDICFLHVPKRIRITVPKEFL